MPAVMKAEKAWNLRVTTAKLNGWLEGNDREAPAATGGRTPLPHPLHDTGEIAPADVCSFSPRLAATCQ